MDDVDFSPVFQEDDPSAAYDILLEPLKLY